MLYPTAYPMARDDATSAAVVRTRVDVYVY